MDLETLASAVSQIAEEHNISSEAVVGIIEKAIASAYKKDYGQSGQKIEANFNPSTGEVEFWQIKEVVDEEDKEDMYFDEHRHILRSEAEELENYDEDEDEVRISLEEKRDFGRIAAQTAKQVILQKVQEAQRQSIYEKYKDRAGEVISGIAQRQEDSTVLFDLGDTLGILPYGEQIPGEQYKAGRRKMLYILKVEETTKGPKIYLSRAYPKLVSALFKREVPEIDEGKLEIKAIAREAGSHTKVAVAAEDDSVDPIGAMVGQRGTRILAVTNELDGEKIDVIKWSDDPDEFIANALSPAKVLQVEIQDKNKALVIVEEDQLSLAIGSKGQNVRLAAQLTGWKIDVQGENGETEEDFEDQDEKEEVTAESEEEVEEEEDKNSDEKDQDEDEEDKDDNEDDDEQDEDDDKKEDEDDEEDEDKDEDEDEDKKGD